MLLERHSSSVPRRSKRVRAVKHLIDESGTSLIAVQHNMSTDRLFIIPVNFRNELIFGQHASSTSVRDCITADMQGRSVRDKQNPKCKYLSLLSCPIDGWISTKLSHSKRSSPSSIGTPEKSGVLIRFLEPERLMNFKLTEHCYQKNKKEFSLNVEISICSYT